MSRKRILLDFYDHNKNFMCRLMSKMLYECCKNANDWWIKISNFVKTHAQWSYLGYIVGLGDRHTDNILFTKEAKLVHIDF